MRKTICLGLALVLTATAGLVIGQEQPKPAADDKAISFENLQAVRMKAEKYDNEGKYVEALQYHLEYSRQAQGLGRPDLVAWGKNNAAYMIIKRHKLDAAVDLAPARKLLEEAMAIKEASEDCRKCLELNMEYINLFQKK